MILLKRLRLYIASIQQNKDEINKLKSDTSQPDINNNIQRQVLALQDVIYGSEALESDLNMGNNRITNLAHPRNPKDSTDHERDSVTAGYFY